MSELLICSALLAVPVVPSVYAAIIFRRKRQQ